MIRNGLICLLAAALALFGVVAPATAAEGPGAQANSTGAQASSPEPKTSLAELEDEVMCPVCGTLLGLSQAPQADRQRALIERLIDQGLTKEEIKDELVAEYGPQVLALPDDSGFNLAAYLVPIVGLTLAAVLLFFAVRRWRRETGEADAARPGPSTDRPGGSDGLSADEADRLDKDLARYDL